MSALPCLAPPVRQVFIAPWMLHNLLAAIDRVLGAGRLLVWIFE
jgi:hypothetical protein